MDEAELRGWQPGRVVVASLLAADKDAVGVRHRERGVQRARILRYVLQQKQAEAELGDWPL